MSTDQLPYYNTDITKDLRNLLRREALVAEHNEKLTKTQLDIIYDQKWFKLFVPVALGGLNLDLPQALQLEEDLARIDGSLGWTVTLCSGANMFVGYIHPAVAVEIFEDKKVCFGGSGRSSGIAEKKDDRYIVSGNWKYATGAPHNTHFTANCRLYENGKPLNDENGNAAIKSFFFNREEVNVTADWNMMGLKATAGHSFEVNQLQVNANRSFNILPSAASITEAVYLYPFVQFAETTLAVNTSGMVLHFLECVGDILSRKQLQTTTKLVFDSVQIMEEKTDQFLITRKAFYQSVEKSWNALLQNDPNYACCLKEVSCISRKLVQKGRELIATVFPFCGMEGASLHSEVNMIWRDIHTASQHSLLNYPPA